MTLKEKTMRTQSVEIRSSDGFSVKGSAAYLQVYISR